METKDVIFELRTKNGLSQDALAEKLYVYFEAQLPKLNYWQPHE